MSTKPTKITSHTPYGVPTGLTIFATDEPGHGGAFHRYSLGGFDLTKNASWVQQPGAPVSAPVTGMQVLFQNGPIPLAGSNGVTIEALLALAEHRLKCFQIGPYSCRENALALTAIQDALHWLHHRTTDRLTRGVEGVPTK